jgi:hypothetical protein
MKSNKHKGPALEAFLEEQGLKEELSAIVAKERIAFQLQQAMKKKRITKVKLAELIGQYYDRNAATGGADCRAGVAGGVGVNAGSLTLPESEKEVNCFDASPVLGCFHEHERNQTVRARDIQHP